MFGPAFTPWTYVRAFRLSLRAKAVRRVAAFDAEERVFYRRLTL
jgi:hypothetical protein